MALLRCWQWGSGGGGGGGDEGCDLYVTCEAFSIKSPVSDGLLG